MSVNPPVRPSHRHLAGERGIALVVTLMAMMLMTVLGAALLLTTTTETGIARNFRSNTEALYAADAAAERALADVLAIPDWNTMLNGTRRSSFVDGAPGGTRRIAGGAPLDLGELVNMANCGKSSSCSQSDIQAVTLDRPWGANNPRWQLFAYGELNGMSPAATVDSPYYVVVMVADDPSENDDDPLRDGAAACPPGPAPGCNPGSGVLAMRAEAFGPFGAHKAIELTVARTELKDDGDQPGGEQNRRVHKAPVQEPGKTLGWEELTLATGAVE